jgi:cyclophilin family peptidyl-prolyl cis-trans isomerase
VKHLPRRTWANRPFRLLLAAPLILAGACANAPGTSDIATVTVPPDQLVLAQRILLAEDQRGRGDEGSAPLLEGIAATDAGIRRLAVRAIGRLEADSLVVAIAPLLGDADAGVRAEAANAAGQAVMRSEPSAARTALAARLSQEPDPYVRGVLGQTLGRLRHATPVEIAATAALLDGIDVPGDSARVALAKGYFHLARQPAARGALPAGTVARLRTLAAQRETGPDVAARRIRTLAAAALIAARAASEQDLELLLADQQPLVRREAAAGLASIADAAAAARLAAGALADPSGMVRYEAIRAITRLAPAGACEHLTAAFDDDDAHAALLAIDLAATACQADAAAAQRLATMARALPAGDAGWHRAAHALVALATLTPADARPLVPNLAAHTSPFVRAYAARAAATIRADDVLRGLADDAHPIVRHAAVEGLAATAGHAADNVYLAQLTADDAQLLIAAAAALEGSPSPEASDALFAALDRVTSARRETSRDARAALITRIRELGTGDAAGRLQPYLADFDPAIANAAADVLEAWTGERPPLALRPLPRAAVPPPAMLDELAATEVVLTMRGGEEIVIRLRPWLAPTNAGRFARLAAQGYFDGLTFHRIAPNFVVQGGSPNANEYAGDGPFSRDELGIDGNWRGTVGLSTRGRDTGDAQIYINLIDNIRLDHDYTVYGEVVRGMEVVDRLLEGAVIDKITVR